MNEGGILTLGDGTRVPVRRVRVGDAAALQRLVGRSSDRSVELRFFGPLKALSDDMARRFADVDGRDKFALVALDPEYPEEIVGVVRYAREGDQDGAEYAALIEDRFQGKGLGTRLTRCLIEAARENGIGYLYALVKRENADMLRLLRHLDFPERKSWQDGNERVEIYLAG
ncbi:MAG TPA: GNAT family N-acetyltransferase [Rubrobacter sp.]|nr:GNAT family N-acetyltransferase [Rubrobacter sp.]